MRAVDLTVEIETFERQRNEWRAAFGAKWLLVVDRTCEGAFDEFEDAAAFALAQFADQDFLIRHVDATEPFIPLVVVEHT